MDLSIVIVSYNVRELLRACLASLPTGAEGLQYEVVVVDNVSSDGSADLAASFPGVKVVRSATNAGYAQANNQGFVATSGRYVAYLNPDTVVPHGVFRALVTNMDAQPSIGACSPQLLRPGGAPQVYAYGEDPTLLYLARRAVARLFRRHLHDWALREPVRVGWVSGACLVARRAAIEAAGGFDEAMFMYFEDNDLCRRLRLRGWDIVYDPRVSITHVGGASVARNPAARAAYYRSLAHFYRKHFGPVSQAVLQVLLALPRAAARS